MTRRNALILAAQVVVVCVAIAVSVMTSTAADWYPIELVVLLLVLAVGSDLLTVDVRGIRVSGAFLAIVLAMALLGPAAACAMGAVSALIDAIASRRTRQQGFDNVVIWAFFPTMGALLADLMLPEATPSPAHALAFAGVALVVFMLANLINFLMFAITHALRYGSSLIETTRIVYLTVVPTEFACGLLTAGVVFSYGHIGVGAVGLAAVVLFVFQYLLRTGVQAFERGEELTQRTHQLAALQVGLLNTVLQTLSMRDAMTARHSAAVARYAREVARLLGVDEREQDLIHTAALLHDIGKFIFPDSILFADRKLTDEEWETVKLHPEQGARLVRRIEGYGPVAEIVHSHHERYDGRGYPAGISGEDIPLGSRIIAVADTYDVMTSRDSYRRPVSSEAAIMELRRVAGSQLDTVVVEAFVQMIESGRVAFHHADAEDFERELGFDRRVEDYARPRAAAA